ncbi:MAG: DUF4878 domain-containing protein [Bacteroidota bacterium]|nr:DUF4878 domain-containing protein [Bacteroidota bacterium]
MKKTTLLLISAFLLIFSGCQSGGGDPKAVLNHFFDALVKKNIDEAKKYVTKDSEGMMGMVQMGMNSVPDSNGAMMYKKENMEMGDAVITGDKATIPVKDKKSGEVTDFVLKKESGDWKVAFDKSTLMDMAQKKMKEHNINGIKGMDSAHPENMNMDTLQNHLNNMSLEEKEHVQKAMDSATKMIEQMQKNGK